MIIRHTNAMNIRAELEVAISDIIFLTLHIVKTQNYKHILGIQNK